MANPACGVLPLVWGTSIQEENKAVTEGYYNGEGP